MRLRDALPSDYPAFLLLFPELDSEVPTPAAARWAAETLPRTLVAADDDGALLGYLVAHALAGSGHVGQLVVAPTARNLGVGRALLTAAADRFRARGLTRWGLNVRAENAPARHLYAAVGMAPTYASITLRFSDWTALDALPPDPPGVSPDEPTPEEDADAEVEIGLLPGQLADVRVRPPRLARVLRRARAVVGAVVFDPDFGVASPFRVAEPALAGTLLRALRPHGRLPRLDVKIDARADVANLLRSAGAEDRHASVHYEGAL